MKASHYDLKFHMKRMRTEDAAPAVPEHDASSSHSTGCTEIEPQRRAKGKKGSNIVEVPVDRVMTTSQMLKAARPLRVASVPNNKVGTLEIYKRFAAEYDLLMARHDCTLLQLYFKKLIINNFGTKVKSGISIGDFGCGTGRIACLIAEVCRCDGTEQSLKPSSSGEGRLPALSLVCGYDKEIDMLNVAKNKIEGVIGPNIHLLDCAEAVPSSPSGAAFVCLRPFHFEHIRQGALRPPHPKLDLVVCGWSLSYVMRAQWGGEKWHQAVKETVDEMLQVLSDDGVLVIVETLGNGCEEPTRRNTMLEYLEGILGFEREWIRTDYLFSDSAEGYALCRFFFASGVAEEYQRQGKTVWPECTGVWSRRKHRDVIAPE